MPKKSTKRTWKNVTIHQEEEQALMEFQKRLADHLGFMPTISQTLRWLITNAERLLK